MAFVLRDVFEAYDRSDAALGKEIKAQDAIINTQSALMVQLQSELGELRKQTVETELAIININTMLKDAGFQGFEVQPRKERTVKADGTVEMVPQNPPINYEVVRTDTGEVAEDLSEGEKNFIAFLYFQQQVFGSESAEGDERQKIVVIDDPVSSMDSSALFIIGEQVRKMVEICRNNADNRNAVVKGNFIKQIFILTHNAYFHREVTYPHANRYEFLSFYLVRKRNNKSSVDLWTKVDPEEPSQRINNNPVKNSYAALWEEYKELKKIEAVVPLMNVIRRILEYYFLQICGYDGSQLRQKILEENKLAYTHDKDGNEDYTKFDMATSMLSYIAASAYGVNEGFHFVDDVLDTELCTETFQMIFQHMGQEQHFNMMMDVK
jgi:wobble nucleotide-excising tRNase